MNHRPDRVRCAAGSTEVSDHRELIMLVLSRTRHESIIVSDSDGGCLLTVIDVTGDEVSFLVSHTSIDTPGILNPSTKTLARDASFKIGTTAEVTLVDVREEKARILIKTSKSAEVHRFEVWEAFQREQRRRNGGDAVDGLAGSPVPRPGDPKPPSLDVRLDEPPAADDGE